MQTNYNRMNHSKEQQTKVTEQSKETRFPVEESSNSVETPTATSTSTEKQLSGVYVVVGCSLLMVRKENKSDAEQVTLLKAGEAVDVLEHNGEWCNIKTNDGLEGFCKTQYLKPRG